MDANITNSSLPSLPSGNHQLPSEDGATPARSPAPTIDAPAIDNALPSSATAAVPAAPPAIEERRRSPRFECPGSVEISFAGSDVPVPGTLTNISPHGCYVKTHATLPLDTVVSLTIDSLGFRVRLQAQVRAAYPSGGMGLCFSVMDPAQHAQLELLLKALCAARHPQL